MKYFEKRKLKKFLSNLNKNADKFPKDYIISKRTHIDTIEWLIAYYENRTASNPRQLLEECIKPYGKPDIIERNWNYDMISIYVLYNWVYYKKIVGF